MTKNFLCLQVLLLLVLFVSLGQGQNCKEPAICINVRKCDYFMNKINATGLTSTLNKEIKGLKCGFEGKDLMVCCNTVTVRIKGGDTFYDATQHPNFRLLPNNCGSKQERKIHGGRIAYILEMPWIALLSYKVGQTIQTNCGGTIIHEKYILTAAHCVHSTLVSVRVGEHNTATDPDCFDDNGVKICGEPVQIMKVESAVAHPNFSYGTLTDDIALVRLAQSIDFSKTGSPCPICLPYTRELQNENLQNVTAVVAGWGHTEFGYQSNILRIVDLPVLSNEACEHFNRATVPDSQICAGGVKDKDTCQGDSGGPLIFSGRFKKKGVRKVIRGISSRGGSRCAESFPSTFTRVSSYIEWILDNMKE